MDKPVTPTITVRPSKALRPRLSKLAEDLDKSEGEVMLNCTEAILDMLDTGRDVVPPLVRAARILREHNATFSKTPVPIADRRDKREVAGYVDGCVQAGTVSGVCADNPPVMLPIPPEWTQPVDFVTKVCGDSMTGLIEDGDLAAFVKADKATNGEVVCALVDGQMVLKMFSESGGKAFLRSLNPDAKKYPPIPWTPEIRIQGHYRGIFPALAKPTRKRP